MLTSDKIDLPPMQMPADRKRKRAAAACTNCQSRKVRCNAEEGTPCYNCRSDSLECTLAERKRKRYCSVANLPLTESHRNEPIYSTPGFTISHHDIDPSYSISERPVSPVLPVTPAFTERDETGAEAVRKWVNECPMRLNDTQQNHLISILNCGLEEKIINRDTVLGPCLAASCHSESTQAMSELASPSHGDLKEIPQMHSSLNHERAESSIEKFPERNSGEVSAWVDRYDNLMELSQRLSVILVNMSKGIPILQYHQSRGNVTFEPEQLVSSSQKYSQDSAAVLPVIEPWRLDKNCPGDVAFNSLSNGSSS